MKITFLCGSLEPGRDGVGDYTRRLAGELIQQGHQVGAVALNDRFLTAQETGVQQADGVDLPVLRLPASWSASQRFEQARSWIDEFAPEWLSLQFVPFSFHPKGLSIKLSKQLIKLGQGRRWHIMFHELWVGMDTEADLKLLWWGKLQRQLIQRLVADLQPAAMHTQSKLYQAKLARVGIHAEYLPLFSNIPVSNGFGARIARPSGGTEKQPVSLVLFGGIHAGAPVKQFSEEAARYARENKVRLRLQIIGRCGAELQTWAATWLSAGLEVEVLGEQPAREISKILEGAALGIATTPLALTEKSGAVAAMLAHGLPVIAVARPWQARGNHCLEVPEGVMEYQQGNFSSCMAGKQLTKAMTVAAVSRQLMEQFLTTNN